MTPKEEDFAARGFYEKHYEIIAEHGFVTNPVIRLQDHPKGGVPICRFCSLSVPAVTFRMKAHAVSELLGNKTIRSMNECDKLQFFLCDGVREPSRTLVAVRKISSSSQREERSASVRYTE
jgi:hypothetical protein